MKQFPERLVLAERLTLAVLLSGVASLALSDFVSPFYWGLVVAMSALRLWRGPVFSLSEMQASMIGWTGFVWVGIELFMGRELVIAFTDFLLILSLAIVVEAATPRNHLHRMLVGFFLILGAAVLTDSVLYIVPLIVFVLFVWRASHCLYGMRLSGGDLPMGRWRSDARAMLGLAVVACLLFVLLPRFNFHSYLKPLQPLMQSSGFSDSVQLGDFASTLDATVVIRVEPLSDDIEAFRKQMVGRYWRGVALSHFNGRGWEKDSERIIRYWRRGKDVVIARRLMGESFAVYRDAISHPYLIVPDGVGSITNLPEGLSLSDQGVFRFVRVPDRRLRIEMQLGEGMSGELLRPPGAEERDLSSIPESVRQWADEIVGDASSPTEVVRRLVNELSGWSYDLNAHIDNRDPVSSFLKIRRGHCELYATALALALRSRGIPARVVNGYFGGEWNEVGGFYLIRQQHAHSWVEAWIDGKWKRYDATPSSRWLLSGVRFPALDEVWESIKLSWYRYVLEFQNNDRLLAFSFLISLFKQYGIWLALLVAAVWGLSGGRLRRILGVFLRRRHGLTGRLDRWLRQRGIERQAYQPVRFLATPRGVDEVQWLRFVREWERQAYGGSERWSVRQLNRHLRAL